MKLRTDQILEEAAELAFVEPPAEANARLEAGDTHEFRLLGPLAVRLTYHRAGPDLFLRGHLAGDLEGTCARCLEKFPHRVDVDFDVVLVPAAEEVAAGKDELSPEELSLGFYDGDEIDLSPLLAEQAILALPTRALCQEACQGLCPVCGIDRNTASCGCASEPAGDPRLAALREYRARPAR